MSNHFLQHPAKFVPNTCQTACGRRADNHYGHRLRTVEGLCRTVYLTSPTAMSTVSPGLYVGVGPGSRSLLAVSLQELVSLDEPAAPGRRNTAPEKIGLT